jgi:hypothetical protein
VEKAGNSFSQVKKVNVIRGDSASLTLCTEKGASLLFLPKMSLPNLILRKTSLTQTDYHSTDSSTVSRSGHIKIERLSHIVTHLNVMRDFALVLDQNKDI